MPTQDWTESETGRSKAGHAAHAATQRRGLNGLLIGQATGAANDNVFRQAFAVAITATAATELWGNHLKAAMGILFILPFIVLAPLAGYLADSMAKDRLIRRIRGAEIGLCVLGTAALAFDNMWLMLATITAFGAQSALFAPVKYAILPELVATEQLATANARVQALGNIAILIGTGLAALAQPELFMGFGGAGTLGAVGISIAALGWWSSFRLPVLPPATTNRESAHQAPAGDNGTGTGTSTGSGLAKDTLSGWQTLRTHGLLDATLGLAGLWLAGAVVQVVLTGVAVHSYGLADLGAASLAVALGGGLAAGALLSPRWHHRAYPAGLPIIGAALSGIGLVLAGRIALTGEHLPWFLGWTIAAGMGAGLWAVPLNAYIQERCPPALRGRAIAAVNVVNVLGIIAGFALVYLSGSLLGLDSAGTLTITGLLALIGTLVYAWRYRRHLVAWGIRQSLRIAYATTVRGRAHLPQTGGCLIVCNHVSFADGLLLAAHLQRPARFLVYHRYFKIPIVGRLLRAAGAIAVPDGASHRQLLASIQTATEAAAAGEVVVIFPEGRLTRSGRMNQFLPGMERIARRAQVPIIPVRLDGLWGALTSHAPRQHLPRLWRPLNLRIGAPLPPMTTAAETRQHIQRLSFEQATTLAQQDRRTLGYAVIQQAKRDPHARAVIDAGGELSRLRLVAAALAVLPELGLADDERHVGVLLPPGRGGAVINLALALAGRTAVNLNHTTGGAGMAVMAEMAGLRTVVSSKLFIRRLGSPDVPGRVLHAEDLIGKLSKTSVLWHMLRIRCLPTSMLCRGRADDIAAIIFSSGSTGTPKGVQITHRQFLANFNGVVEHLALTPKEDVLLSPLPLFHSFGYSIGLFLPLCLGLPVAGHPDPTDAGGIGKLAKKSSTTFLIATPTFVRSWMRRIEPEAFATLRFAVVGAEKCPAELRQRFADRYHAQLLEGYGCTELGPVVSTNAPDYVDSSEPSSAEQHTRDGSVGRALPGIEVVTMHPETGAELPTGEEGLLVVRSPARMAGYLNRDDLTTAAFVHDGYNTGDVGYVDPDGFIFITGRLARFAKIGGEMVPLEAVQEALLAGLDQHLGESDHTLAVSSVPDASRGERLVVLHDGIELSPADIVKAAESLPALFRPRARDVHQVESIPVLGTGKLDLKGLKQLAEEVAG